MIKNSATLFALLACLAIFAPGARAADEVKDVYISALNKILPAAAGANYQAGGVYTTGENNRYYVGTNGIYFNYASGEAVLTADTVRYDTLTFEVQADGHVHIETQEMMWTGDHIHYNLKTHTLISGQFRAGEQPVFVMGEGVAGHVSRKGDTNQLTAHQAYLTTDDYSDPSFGIRASRIRITPGEKVEMWNAVVYVRGVPLFYFPYYVRNIGPRANNFTTTPGYRSRYGPYLLNTYNWYVGDMAEGKLHGDYRFDRGPGAGPDADLHLGKWGEVNLKYYYQQDRKSNYSTNTFPYYGNIPENRQRFYLGWQATPETNLNLKAEVNYQSDPLFLHDFFPSDYTLNPQPNTFVEANKYWDNWSLDTLTTPRVNSYFNQVERLPDVQLTGFRQQVGDTPAYYDSQSSVGWYRLWSANATNGLYTGTNGEYAAQAARADTYHQLTLPWTFFDWLNVTPRVGGRLTYYSSENFTNGQPNPDVYREVFNTGTEISFKASQTWPDVTNSFLQVDGLRHIIEPSANYVFVPDPSTPPAQLPPIDGQAASLLPLPLNFPDYNSIDSIDTMNVVRFGLRNILQTKRDGQLEDLVNWNVLMDWRLDPRPGQEHFNDFYSALSFRPRTWLTASSQLRYDVQGGELNLAFHELTFSPNDRWSWSVSHWYLRSGFVSPDENNFVVNTLFYRLNDNWGVRTEHIFNAADGRLQEQDYTIMRDLRSWTTSLTFRVQNNEGSSADFTVAVAFSLKAVPSTRLGEDAVTPYHLLGE
jgi:hypothetical protein